MAGQVRGALFLRVDSDDGRQLIRAIFSAIYDDKLEVVDQLLKSGVPVSVVDICNKNNTPLHYAVEKEREKIIDLLLQNGADIFVKNGKDETCLDLARICGKADIINILERRASSHQNFSHNILLPQTSRPSAAPGSSTASDVSAQFSCAQVDASNNVGSSRRKRGNSDSLVDDDNNKDFQQKEPKASWIQNEEHLAGSLKMSLHGDDYQLKLLMLFAMQSKGKVLFRLATEMPEAESFDDLVFRFECNDGTVKYRFLQAKHKQHLERANKINVGQLKTGTDGDFSLQKYFISYLKDIEKDDFKDGQIEDFILCTNTTFDFEPNESLKEQKRTRDSKEDWKTYFTILDTKDEILNLGGSLYKISNDASIRRKISDELKPIFLRSLLKHVRMLTLKKMFDNSNEERKLNKIIEALMSDNSDKKCDEIFKKETQIAKRFGDYYEANISGFFDKITFALNQPSGNVLGEMIKESIGAEFNLVNDVTYNGFYRFMSEWMQHRLKTSRAHFLSHADVQIFFENAKEKLASMALISSALLYKGVVKDSGLVFHEDCQSIKTLKSFLSEHQNKKRILLLYSKGPYLSGIKVLQMLNDDFAVDCKIFTTLNSLQLLQGTSANPVAAFRSEHTKYLILEHDEFLQNKQEFLKELFKIAITMHEKKIIIITPFEHQSTNQQFVFSLLPPKWIVEIDDHNNDFTDLTLRSQNYIAQKEVKFQGTVAKIGNIFDDKISRDFIDAEILSKIVLNEAVHIGTELADLGDISYYYIERTFQRNNNIRYSCLERNSDDVFAIANVSPSALASVAINNEICDFQHAKPSSNNKGKIIILNDETSPRNCFAQLCKENTNHTLHYLLCSDPKDLTSSSLIWKETCYKSQQVGSSLNNIRRFIDGNIVTESKPNTITDIDDKVVIISAEPGMGKSTVLTKLADLKTSKTILWVVRINLNDHTKKFLQMITDDMTTGDVIDFLVNTASFKKSCMFERSLFKHWITQKGGIALLFDGFDEISPTYNDEVLTFLKLLTKTKVEKIWITTRPQMRYELEDELGALSFTLKPLTKENQETFLAKYYSQSLSIDENNGRLQGYINYLLVLLSESIADKERLFTGIPLQTRLVAEAFEKNLKDFLSNGSLDKPNLPEKLNLVDLYQRFIERKYLIYRKDKKKQDITNVPVTTDDKIVYKDFMERHKRVALYTLFETTLVHTLFSRGEIEDIHRHIDQIKKGEEMVGLIVQVVDDKPQFVHRTFAEYFSAHWLTEKLNDPVIKLFIESQMFSEVNEVLRNFFDRILAKESPIHMAALNNDMQFFKNNVNMDLNTRDCNGRTALHLAVSHGHVDIVNHFLNTDASKKTMECKDKLFGWTPLRYGAQSRQWYCNELLLKKGANPDDMNVSNAETTDHRGCVAVHIAAERELPNVLNVLLDQGGQVNARDTCKWTPLHRAAEEGALDTVKLLVENKQANINSVRDDGFTPIHNAVYAGNLHVVQYLIASGANINIADIPRGFTPLHWALGRNYKEVAKLLIINGANVSALDLKEDSPLHLACSKRFLDIVTMLTQYGSDLLKSNKKGQLPINIAAYNGYVNIVEYLTEQMRKLHGNSEVVKIAIESALNSAAHGGELNVVEFLVEKGVDINCYHGGYTALYMAAYSGSVDVVNYLLDKGAYVFLSSSHCTILHAAIASNVKEVVECIINEICSKDFENLESHMNAPDSDGNTPLMLIKAGDVNLLAPLLVEFGAKINCKNYNGDTALHWTVEKRDPEMLEYLLQSEADPSIQNKDELSPLKLALRELEKTVANSNDEANCEKLKKIIATLSNIAGDRDALSLKHFVCIGNLDMVKNLVKNGASILAPDATGLTPLHWATMGGHVNIINYLLENNARLDATDERGCVPLHIASKSGRKAAVKLLIKEGSKVNVRDNDEWTPLHYAAEEGHLEVVEYLVSQNADVDAARDDKWIPLHNAVYMDQVNIVKFLARRVQDINKPDLHGKMTPLHWAMVRETSDEIVDALLEAGADVSATDINGNTALHLAASKGETSLQESLLQHGADVNAKSNSGETPLHKATEHYSEKKLKFVKFLFSRCGDTMEVNEPSNDGWTALHLACRNHNEPGIIKALIAGGAELNARGWNSNTPLHRSIECGNIEIVKMLLDNGAELESLTSDGKTPLYVAASKGVVELVQFLVERGANINAKSNRDSMLHQAVCRKAYGMLEFLARNIQEQSIVDGEQYIDVRDYTGRSPLLFAAENGDQVSVQILLRFGADCNIADENGDTALHLAAGNGNLDCVQILLDGHANSDARNRKGQSPLTLVLEKITSGMEGDQENWESIQALLCSISEGEMD